MASRSGDWWLTCNGEVFNHLALRGELGPREWRGGSDIAEAADPGFLLDGRLRDALEVPRAAWPGWLAGAIPLCAWSAEIWCRLALEDQSVAAVEEDLWTAY